MYDVKTNIKSVSAIILGAVFYTVFNWIPVVGSLATGFFTGYIVGGGFRRGFNHGVVSGILGALSLAYAAYSLDFVDASGLSTVLLAFIVWALLVWTTVSVALTGFGAGFGAIGKDINDLIPRELRELFSAGARKQGVDYILCPRCGQGNILDASTCSNCGNPLR